MKQLILKITFVLALAINIAGCNKDNDEPTVDACAAKAGVNPLHPKAAAFQAVLEEYVQRGLPGLILYVKTPQGIWTGAAGKASIETGKPMRPCNFVYSASMAKTFTAVSVMKLVEDGLINLDAPIRTYLSVDLYGRIANFNRATVRQLLNHTSGISNYTNEPQWENDLINNRARGITAQTNLELMYDKPPLFEPGTDFGYSNTNYILLAKIIDQVTGASHANFFTNHIFRPLGMTDIYYQSSPNGMPNSYFDLDEVLNVTDIESRIISNSYGETGIVGLASNYATFVEAIFKGNLIRPASRAAMMEWVFNIPVSNQNYGLGIMYRNTPYGYGIGHTGGGVGTTSDMFYFPNSDVTIVMLTNKESKRLESIELYQEDLWNEVVRVALNR